jgi:hypothetical protein
MKKFLYVLFVSILFSFIGCNENPLETLNSTQYEKRTPTNRDTVKKRVPLEKVLPCLGLTREQHIAIMDALKQERECQMECKKELHDSIRTLRQIYNANMDKYRRVEKTDEIKKEIEILNFEFRQTQRDLEKQYREKLAVCVKNTHTDIETLLRRDQLTLWNIWKATGKIPCDKVRP